MTGPGEISNLIMIFAAALLVAGAATTFVGALGLVRLRGFYQRVHAPTLGTTLGTACITAASMIYFTALGSRAVLHEALILIFVTVTTPITLSIVVRAAALRDKAEKEGLLPGAGE